MSNVSPQRSSNNENDNTLKNSSETKSQPRESVTQDQDSSKNDVALFVRGLLDKEGIHESPINLNITETTPLDAPPLIWHNYDAVPKKMKITNTGHTVILSAKWNQERPYIVGGPLMGKYVFSQMHLHWGANNMEGSEHTVDGGRYTGEMHVVLFKSSYLTQESALKEKDGVVMLVYFLKIQDYPSMGFQVLVDALEKVEKAHTSFKIQPIELGFLIREFVDDYFMYWGTVSTGSCVHYILWLFTRYPIGVSSDQIDALRYLMDSDGQLLQKNFREIQPASARSIFHVSPSASQYSTLLPIPKEIYHGGNDDIKQIYRVEVDYGGQGMKFERVSNNARRVERRKKSSPLYVLSKILNDYLNSSKAASV